MINLIHVLGSNIPHHNCTILKFFNDFFYKDNLFFKKKYFLVVSNNINILNNYSKLNIKIFNSKILIAKTVISLAKKSNYNRFLFHGQFNIYIWLALLFGFIKPHQFLWHIWGADLYEESNLIKFKFFYILRRLSYKKIGCVFATRGDLHYFHQLIPGIPGYVLYFPTRTYKTKFINFNISKKKDITILLGNSADPSNLHEKALKLIKKQFNDKVKIIIPMSYPLNSQIYIKQIENIANREFNKKQVLILKEYIKFKDYVNLIKSCDLGYFIFNRQQGIGTICILIQFCIPFVISDRNTFLKDLKSQNVPVLFYKNKLTASLIDEVKQQMFLLDKQKIDFLFPNFINDWRKAINIAEGLI